MVLPSSFIDEGTRPREGGWQMQGHTARTLGVVAMGEGSSIAGLQTPPCPQLPRGVSGMLERPEPEGVSPSQALGEEGPPLGGECGFRISFQLHQSCLRYPYPAVLPSMPHAFSNPAADPDQSAQRVVGGLLVQWLKSGQTWIPAPAWLLSSCVDLGWSFFFPEPRFPVNWEILRGGGSGR